MGKRDGGESRKNSSDGAWLNPKRFYNGQSAAKPRTEEGSTTIPQGSRGKCLEVERALTDTAGDDIVCAVGKPIEISFENRLD